jgi:hypothetical protein
MTDRNNESSVLSYARVAGLMYLLVIVIGILNETFIVSELIIPGNNAATTNNLTANDLLFRSSIVLELIMYASVVILSWALYMVLKNANKNLALLAMLLRLTEAILGVVLVLLSFLVLALLNGENTLTELEMEKVRTWIGILFNIRTMGLDIVLIFVGLGGTIFCYLFLKSKYVPGILAAWGIFTYLSMLILSIISILFRDHPVILETILYIPGGLFELLFGIWLFFKGVKIQPQREPI